MKRLLYVLLAALALVAPTLAADNAPDNQRDSQKFNFRGPYRGYVQRFVDSLNVHGVVEKWAGRRDSVVWVDPQALPIPGLVGGLVRADTSSKALTMTSDGYLQIVDSDRDRNYINIINMGPANPTVVSGQTVFHDINTCVDVSTYKNLTLLLSWAAADSNTVQLAVQFYNKPSAAWGSNDTPIFRPYFQTAVTAADTTNALLPISSPVPPSIFVYRSAAAPSALAILNLTTLARTPRVFAHAYGVAINLDDYCRSWGYFGFKITNTSASTINGLTAYLVATR